MVSPENRFLKKHEKKKKNTFWNYWDLRIKTFQCETNQAMQLHTENINKG